MISIIMASYNADRYIRGSINSIINQSYKNWELIIIDDGSSDDTVKITKEFNDSRIKYYYQEKQGVSAARNIGLSHMKGKYFSFLDADDFMPPESLENRLNVFHRNPNADFVDGTVHIYDRSLEKKQSEWVPSYRGNPLDQLLSLSENCFFGNTWLVKRIKDRIYQFHEDLTHGEELLFYIELALQGGQYNYTDDVILHYRRGHTSAMKNLRGLEKGYRSIYHSILNMDQIPQENADMFRKKAQNIMLKSYLGKLKPYQALLSQIKKW